MAENLRPLCIICGNELYSDEDYRFCKECVKFWKRDLEEGRIPPGYTKETFTLDRWRVVRIFENQKDKTREEIKEDIDRYLYPEKFKEKESLEERRDPIVEGREAEMKRRQKYCEDFRNHKNYIY